MRALESWGPPCQESVDAGRSLQQVFLLDHAGRATDLTYPECAGTLVVLDGNFASI